MFELNEHTREILGKPNFWCGPIAHAMKKAGQNIPTNAEDEQAAVIYWLLTIYEKHGVDWRIQAQTELQAIIKAANKTEYAEPSPTTSQPPSSKDE